MNAEPDPRRLLIAGTAAMALSDADRIGARLDRARSEPLVLGAISTGRAEELIGEIRSGHSAR